MTPARSLRCPLKLAWKLWKNSGWVWWDWRGDPCAKGLPQYGGLDREGNVLEAVSPPGIGEGQPRDLDTVQSHSRPARARRTRKNGAPISAVRLTFLVGEDGTLASVAVSTSSGNQGLDRTAREILSEAAPFPPPPTGASREQRTFVVPFHFR